MATGEPQETDLTGDAGSKPGEIEREARAQALLAAIVTSSDDAIISKTLDGVIQSWNAGAERIFGYTAEEAIGRPVTMLIPLDRQDEEPALLSRLRRGERIDHFETVRVTKSGRLLHISLTVSPIRDSSGKIVGASKVARDITETRRAMEALRDADRRKDEFLAILAHELRNPLAPIRNSLHILQLRAPHDETLSRVVGMMERQVTHMVRLVDDLLEVSRITRGKIELRRARVPVAAVIQAAVETSRPLIDAANHQLTIDMPTEPLSIKGDPIRLAQVVSNLLNNAAKYTERGGQISLRVRRDQSMIVVSVRDTGHGIPPNMLPFVFDMFMQVDRSDLAQGGLGIGLTLVKTLVELHGGHVVARSEGLGKGSEFTVHLPVLTENQGGDADRAAARPPKLLLSKRVMVVDDNSDAAESLGLLLNLLGAEVRVAASGAEALEILDSYQPSVVILDIGMPVMDGYETARQIRRRPQSNGVTLIALSGWGQEEDRRKSRDAGFDYHLIKPADIDALQILLATPNSRSVESASD